ncbi:AraC family transcriptional regulator [Microbacterium sp. ASV49]|uniref:Helix-turn-helix domain-containing protein n=1 Tax=Microbacterium candidum TaxID=3041922 RepID=A0ABT7N210_9MICO|nr:helix-turn-helix domain-containing protein [Microbacterium sp. ASV49]MDL9980717.1 helix-turn-helix domain-containing protein [Microbacterium sp. ASV49]
MTDPNRGVLYPGDLPRFTRIAAEGDVADLVEWFWIPQWDLPDGVSSAQRTLGYPAANLVIEGDDVGLWGATTHVAERVLEGSGWAVGALLTPAGFAALTAAPRDLVDTHVLLDAPEVVASVSAVMPEDHSAAIAAFGAWLVDRAGALTGEGRLANDMVRMLMNDSSILRIEDAAARLAVSPRTLQRLAHRTVGLPPAAIIRRRRLQEAAQRVREAPGVRLADVAAELGYADQAHLANDFRTVLGLTASEYRENP